MLYLKIQRKTEKKVPLFSHMFVFTTTTKRKSPLQKQDTADSSTLCTPRTLAHPGHGCSANCESIESRQWLKNINGSFIIYLNESIKSLLNKPHQPGQVFLPWDKLPPVLGHLLCDISYRERGRRGCLTIVEGRQVSDKSYSTQHAFPAIQRDNHQGTMWCHLHRVLPGPERCSRSPMDLTEHPQAVSGVPSGVGLPHCISINDFSELLS